MGNPHTPTSLIWGGEGLESTETCKNGELVEGGIQLKEVYSNHCYCILVEKVKNCQRAKNKTKNKKTK